VCWISSQGLLRIGNSGAATNGYTPASGLNIRVPNIIFTTSAGAGTNNTPSNTLTTRYGMVTTGGAAINIDKSQWSWYANLDGCASITISNCAFNDSLKIASCASAMSVSNVCVGITNGATATFAMNFANCSSGGTVSNSVFNTGANTGQSISACNNLTLSSVIFRTSILRTGQTGGGITLQNSTAIDFTNCTIIGGSIAMFASISNTITNLVYVDNITGSTSSTNPCSCVVISSKSNDVIVDGITFGVANTNPYTALLRVNVASNIKLRNIGSAASPMSMGTAPNATGAILDYFGSAEDIQIQRVYTSALRTQVVTGAGGIRPNGVTFESAWGDAATPVGDIYADNVVIKGQYGGSSGPVSFSAASYGTHFFDSFYSSTAGNIGLFFNEPTAATTPYVDVTHMTQGNGSGFTSTGTLQLVNLNEYVVWEWPHYILGYTSLANVAPTTAGTNVSNLTLQYDIDKGSGFSGSYQTLNATNLSAETGISATTGFKLRIKATCNTASSTNSINKLYIQGTTDSSSQQTQYPLDVYTLTVTGIVSGSDVVVMTAGTSTVLGYSENGASSTFTYEYYSAQTVDIGVFKPGYIPLYVRSLALGTSGASIPVQQFADRNYNNP